MQAKSKMDAVFGDVERFCSQTPWMQWVLPVLVRSGTLAFLQRKRSRASRTHVEFQKFCDDHEEELQKLADMLEDDFSRFTLERLLAYRKTNDAKYLKGIVVRPQYFQKDIFGPVQDEVFVDGGAFIGDTLDAFMKEFTGGYKKIYSWEPDESNIKFLQRRQEKYKNITVLPYGLWSEETELCFDQQGNSNSAIVEQNGQTAQYVKVNSIDNLCADEKITFIKMDIEGSELAALHGAENVIKRDKPRMAICIYHKPEDLYAIPFWIKSAVPEYKLYIRQHSRSWTETVVYATL